MGNAHNVKANYTEFIMSTNCDEMKKETKASHLNPTWFDAPDGSDLEKYINNKVKTFTKAKPIGKISALVVPHAGYAYSLDTALEAYALLKKEDYDRVLVLSPCHRYPFFEKVGIEPVGRLKTPTGEISFDKDFSEKLKMLEEVVEIEEASKAEHSIHVQMPLIRHFLGDIPVAGLMFGKWKYGKSMEDFAKNLYKILDTYDGGIGRTLFIVSTDFTHYGANFGYLPFVEDIKSNIEQLDQNVYQAFAAHEIELFEKVMHKTKATVCGQVALKFLLTLMPNKIKAEQVAYTTSAENTGDYSHSVSYLSALVFAEWKKGFNARLPEISEEEKSRFTSEEKQMMLDIAKACVQYSVQYDQVAQVDYDTVPEKFKEDCAVFVTLEKNGQLRGCIGDIVPQRPLIDSIIQRAYSAALEDRRFEKVRVDELPYIDVEISVLSPLMPIISYKDIIIGKHGVILQKEKNSAVFLPHVATEQGWNKEEMLMHLAQKAGLNPHEIKENWDQCTFYVFTAELIKD